MTPACTISTYALPIFSFFHPPPPALVVFPGSSCVTTWRNLRAEAISPAATRPASRSRWKPILVARSTSPNKRLRNGRVARCDRRDNRPAICEDGRNVVPRQSRCDLASRPSVHQMGVGANRDSPKIDPRAFNIDALSQQMCARRVHPSIESANACATSEVARATLQSGWASAASVKRQRAAGSSLSAREGRSDRVGMPRRSNRSANAKRSASLRNGARRRSRPARSLPRR